MSDDRVYVERNTRERERLRALIERVTDDELRLPVNEYWTVAGVLGHIAFWDGRALWLAGKLERGVPFTPADVEPDDVSWVNDSTRPLIHAIDPRVRAQIVAAVMLGLFLAALDQTVVGTALPRIVTDLHGNDIYTWAFTAYLLTATISGPIYGKLSDLFGRRPVLLFAVAVFLVGSLLSGVSREMWQLVGSRALQGLGAGALFPVALAVIGDLFDAAERGKYQGFVGAVFGLSSLVGPAIGGIITDTVGWQWVVFVNLPIGAVVFAVIWLSLPRIRPSGANPAVDYRGAYHLASP